jgi:YD repeat-containing protein
MKTKSRIIILTVLTISLVCIFSTAAFTEPPPPKKDGNTITYYREDGSIDRKEELDNKGNVKWTTYYTADGTTDVYPDGRKEYRDTHGRLYLTIYYNKDGSISHTWDGYAKTIYHYNKDGTVSHLTKDGNEIMRFHYNKDGTITIYHTFYGKITFDTDGNVISCQDKRVKEKLKYDNESSGYLIGDGCIYKEENDGSKTYYTYDNKTNKLRKWYTRHRDGRVTWYDADGNVETVFYPATMYRVEGPGDKDIYGGTVKEIYYEEKKPPGVDKRKTQEEKLWYTKNKDGSKSYWSSPIPVGGVPLFVVHPDGSVTYYNQRGPGTEPVEVMLSMWGCYKKYTKHPDGSKTYYDMNNLRSHTKHPDGSVTYYTDGKKGRNKYKTEHPDGSTTYYDDNGKVCQYRYPDGDVAYYNEDGNLTKVEHSDGKTTHYKDGKENYAEDYGKKTYYYEKISRGQMFDMKFFNDPMELPDSSAMIDPDEDERNKTKKGETDETGLFNKGIEPPRTYTDKDGNVVTEYQDGTKKYTDKDGNDVTEHSSGAKRVCKKDGSCTYYDEDGKKIGEENPSGVISFFKYEFDDTSGKEVVKELQYEVDKDGSFREIGDGGEMGSLDTPPPKAGDKEETDSPVIGTPEPGSSKDDYMEDEDGNRTYYDAYGNKEYTISEDENLITTYNPDGTIYMLEDRGKGYSIEYFYEDGILYYTINSETGETTYYDDDGEALYRENEDGSITYLDSTEEIDEDELLEEATLLFDETEDLAPTSMEMEDDLFNKGLPPGMEPSDDGVPYEMIEGDEEIIDLGVETNDGSMTIE